MIAPADVPDAALAVTPHSDHPPELPPDRRRDPAPVPPGTERRAGGDRREIPRSGRWWVFVRTRRLRCPHGHHIPHTFAVTEGGFTRCSHRAGDYRSECGAWVYLFAVRGGGVIVAAVSLEEMREMEALATPAEMIDFLGIWPN